MMNLAIVKDAIDKTMQCPNDLIQELFKDVRFAHQYKTKNQQIPWENTSLSGDFYFSEKK